MPQKCHTKGQAFFFLPSCPFMMDVLILALLTTPTSVAAGASGWKAGPSASKVGLFNPYDTVNRFPPAASAQDVAQRGFCQKPVMQQLRFDITPDWEMANTICCHNTKYAEPSGYFETNRVNLFSRFKSEEKSHTFYDSVCGVPLFQAPVGRSLADWQAESSAHGWPSFRPAEVVAQNLVLYPSGEVRSICGTHLGHNIPDSKGARYCIDLACIAGLPAFGVTQEPQVAKARLPRAASTAAPRQISRVRAAPGQNSRQTRALAHISRYSALDTEKQKHKKHKVRKLPWRDTVGELGDSPSTGGRGARRLLAVGEGGEGGEAGGGGGGYVEEVRRQKGLLQGMIDNTAELNRQNAAYEQERQKLISDNERLAALISQDPDTQASLLQGRSVYELAALSILGVMIIFFYQQRRARSRL